MAIRTANNQSLTEITTLPSAVSTGSLVLLATETASTSATLDFTSGIDSTYDEYVFKFIDIHPATDGAEFQMQSSIDAGSNYNVACTTALFMANHHEDDSDASLGYSTTHDAAQSTSFITLIPNMNNANDASCSGSLKYFNPSNATFVKHFLGDFQGMQFSDSGKSKRSMTGGYFNTTSAVDAIQFKFSSGNMDAGTIKMYGVT